MNKHEEYCERARKLYYEIMNIFNKHYPEYEQDDEDNEDIITLNNMGNVESIIIVIIREKGIQTANTIHLDSMKYLHFLYSEFQRMSTLTKVSLITGESDLKEYDKDIQKSFKEKDKKVRVDIE